MLLAFWPREQGALLWFTITGLIDFLRLQAERTAFGLGERATGTGLRCPQQRIIRGRSVRKSARQVAMGGAAAIPNIFLVRCPTRQRARVCLRTLRPTLYDFECFVPHQKASSDLYENSLLHVTPNRLDLRHGITTSWVTASVPVSRSRWCQS
jgi:hypothetical protein